MRPKVSIIIPAYNHSQYVGQAVQSVLDQSFRGFEIIVVDDGSTDDTRTVVSQFGNKVRYLWQENQGLSAARNNGIRTAAGEFIGLLDADDLLEPNFLSTLLPILDLHLDVDAVYCGYQFIDDQDNPLPQRETRSLPEGRFHEAILDGNFLAPESILARRDCYRKVGLFDEELQACEDWDMWLRISRQHKVIGTSCVLTLHRVLPDSMSTDPERMLRNRMAVLSKYFGRRVPQTSMWSDKRRRAHGRAYLMSSVEFLQIQDVTNAYSCFRNLVKICPELLFELDTMYELAWGGVAKGYRGDFNSIEILSNGMLLIGMLDKFFSVEMDIFMQDHFKAMVYSNAYFALGLLSYGARSFKETRYFLSRALRAYPKIILSPQLLPTLIKSMMGARLIDWLKMRHHSFGSAKS